MDGTTLTHLVELVLVFPIVAICKNCLDRVWFRLGVM
jgi:hypothetical protein